MERFIRLRFGSCKDLCRARALINRRAARTRINAHARARARSAASIHEDVGGIILSGDSPIRRQTVLDRGRGTGSRGREGGNAESLARVDVISRARLLSERETKLQNVHFLVPRILCARTRHLNSLGQSRNAAVRFISRVVRRDDDDDDDDEKDITKREDDKSSQVLKFNVSPGSILRASSLDIEEDGAIIDCPRAERATRIVTREGR